jgi:hypothetical protein
MWVRTQERTLLLECKHFAIDIPDKTIYSDGVRLATYATKERCLEVLDEIQEHIETRIVADEIMKRITDISDNYDAEESVNRLKSLACIYQMPKE